MNLRSFVALMAATLSLLGGMALAAPLPHEQSLMTETDGAITTKTSTNEVTIASKDTVYLKMADARPM
ncbi:hypothetical protein CROQUDRAFT_266838 [Cronartium quercuum f. sp. fusiforme G11]|uniref:Uncharacterized protein n=1 Tax=Cronartium quercuum f. sp. fusiforme G11 TaxID=708437 RepID=A0A9P6T7U8_9BASI|nr:hypothetical protein CROQUDRAFT_266838 [Cronartium quercuum f. sp. fusiforme G11]